ncbi:DUF4177 domain-containing protein [Paracoccus ravus]|uniref:DUF4177 domain-containing protein n=1 Tax=Paracoccus ravus TaxID=2447760 RepID=UPI00106EE69C|nr:DUF4177 domain-containing protein [Paracoccus ravus]
MVYEYTVIPAPSRGEKSKGAKTGIERFSATLAAALNEMAQDGWEYVRAETLPCEERAGLTGRTTIYHNILVFRRAVDDGEEILPIPVAAQEPEPVEADLPADQAEPTPDAPVRPPFSEPMRAMARPTQSRAGEPPLTAPPQLAPSGPRLGPASR